MKKFLVFTLAFLIGTPVSIFSAPIKSQQTLKELRGSARAKPPKLAPDLEEMLAQDDDDQRQALNGKTLWQVRSERLAQRTKKVGANPSSENEISVGLKTSRGVALPSAEVIAEAQQSFIIQTDGTTPNALLEEKLARLGGRISQKHSGMGMLTIEAPRSAIRQLAAEGSIAYVRIARS
jgi:hypothetical protein